MHKKKKEHEKKGHGMAKKHHHGMDGMAEHKKPAKKHMARGR